MNDKIKSLIWKAGSKYYSEPPRRQVTGVTMTFEEIEKFAELIIKDCIHEIETYQIPVGNSAAGEMAREWTYDALKEIRNGIMERFGVTKD